MKSAKGSLGRIEEFEPPTFIANRTTVACIALAPDPIGESSAEVDVQFEPIGTIRTPFTDPRNMPIQPAGAAGVGGSIEVLPEYAMGLKDLVGFSHIILLYTFHRSHGYALEVVPFLDTRSHGVFATRAPRRPNPIGISVVRLLEVEGEILHVDGIDVLDGTPLLDIKPYVPDFDAPQDIRTGWLAELSRDARAKRSDDRFA